MDAFRHRKSPLSDRFLGPFSKQETLTTVIGTSDELDEGEVFWIGTDFSSEITSSSSMAIAGASSSASSGSFRRLAEKNFGILAALPEDEKKRTIRNPSFLQRKSSISSSSSSTSTSPSSSSARMIPVIPKPKQEYAFSIPAGRIHQQSAPVNVPLVPMRTRRQMELSREMEEEEKDDEDEEMLPPHEIVARASAKESPMTTFSVLEGVGRTLKGRDLRQVRNAVWRQTGFLD